MCAGLLETRGSELRLLKSTSNAENFICRLSWSIASHFGAIHSWNACCSPKLQKKSLKPPFLGVQGHSRLSMLTFLSSLLLVLVMISSMSVPICNYLHVKWANNGRIMLFWGRCSSFSLLFVGTFFTQQREILLQNTRDSRLSCGENSKSLFRS